MSGIFKKFRPGKKLLSSWDCRYHHFLWNTFTTRIGFGWSTNQSYKNCGSSSYKVSIHFETVLIKSSYFSCNGLQGQQYLISFATSLSILLRGTKKKEKLLITHLIIYMHLIKTTASLSSTNILDLVQVLKALKVKLKSMKKIIIILQTRRWLRKKWSNSSQDYRGHSAAKTRTRHGSPGS